MLCPHHKVGPLPERVQAPYGLIPGVCVGDPQFAVTTHRTDQPDRPVRSRFQVDEQAPVDEPDPSPVTGMRRAGARHFLRALWNVNTSNQEVSRWWMVADDGPLIAASYDQNHRPSPKSRPQTLFVGGQGICCLDPHPRDRSPVRF